MTKLALRVSRRFSHLRGRGNRMARPKTFKTEEAAQKWAKENGLEHFTVENLKSPEAATKKLRIIPIEK